MFNGENVQKTYKELPEFSSTDDIFLNNFAGTVIYRTSFTGDGSYPYLDLGEVNQGITEVYLNDELIGTKWYGNHQYDLSSLIQEGDNKLEIRYTTVLANYCKSLKDNPTAQRWTAGYEKIPLGIQGPVSLVRLKE